MRIRFLIAALALALALPACSLSGSDASPTITPIDFSRYTQDPDQLVGTWQWERSTTYFTSSGRPDVRTPASTGETRRLVFTADDSVRVYRSDTLVERTTRQHYLEGTQWGTRGDTLAISTAFRDGPERVYQRSE
jgi:hypothetical protein